MFPLTSSWWNVFFVCRTPCAQWPSRQWKRPDWRRSSRNCSIQKNSRWVMVTQMWSRTRGNVFVTGRLFAVAQTYFEDNPRDLQLLRHDKDLHPAVVKPHLKNVPDYLSKKHAQTHSHTGNQRSVRSNLWFRLTPSVPESLKGVINPLSRRNRRKKKEKSKPEGVSKPSFKVSLWKVWKVPRVPFLPASFTHEHNKEKSVSG